MAISCEDLLRMSEIANNTSSRTVEDKHKPEINYKLELINHKGLLGPNRRNEYNKTPELTGLRTFNTHFFASKFDVVVFSVEMFDGCESGV